MSFSTSKFKQNILNNQQNVLYTILIMIMHLTYGINMNILGSSLVDLRFIFNVSIETMSNVAVALGIGYLMGALVGWSFKWLNRQLVLTLLLLLMALTIVLMPHYRHLWIALLALAINGIACGAWDASSGYWTVEMWPQANGPLLQLLQFMFGCGAVVAPLLVAPFLYGETKVLANNQSIMVEDRIELLSVPFSICGLLVAIVPVILSILFCVNRYEKSSSTISTPEQSAEISKKLTKIPNRRIKLILCGICLASYATAEMGWYGFASALYQSLPIKSSATEGAYVMSLFWATFTLGRLVTAFISVKLVPDWILAYHYLITFVSIGITYFGRNNPILVYVGSILLGYGYSAMWPGILAFTERHLKLSDRICSLYSFLTGLMSLVIPLVLGQTFEKHPLILFLLETLFCILSFATFVTVRFWIDQDNRN